MRIKLAYLGVVLIWTTTPLGVKWSGEGLSFVLGATARMSLGALLLLIFMLATRQALAFHSRARWTYLAVSAQIFLSMLITYWGAQFIPSGWISVIFGLSPFMTAFMAAAFLQERSLGWRKLFAYALGVGGLATMFMSALDLSHQALLGVGAILLATFIHAASAVWVKRIDARLPALQQICGGLLFSLPMYYLTWYSLDGAQLPLEIPDRSLYAIVYLGTVATILGFAFYYYLLTHMPATHVAMINLLTPVLSLWLGHGINHEALSMKVLIGTALIMTALLIHQAAARRERVRLD